MGGEQHIVTDFGPTFNRLADRGFVESRMRCPAKFLATCESLAVPCLDVTENLRATLRSGILVYAVKATGALRAMR